jgi:uncharacterized membrane protein YfcA
VFLSVPQALSIAFGAALVSVVDYRVLIATVGVAFGLSALYLLTRKEQRRSPDEASEVPEVSEVSEEPVESAGPLATS